jgi:hypothetical protein
MSCIDEILNQEKFKDLPRESVEALVAELNTIKADPEYHVKSKAIKNRRKLDAREEIAIQAREISVVRPELRRRAAEFNPKIPQESFQNLATKVHSDVDTFFTSIVGTMLKGLDKVPGFVKDGKLETELKIAKARDAIHNGEDLSQFDQHIVDATRAILAGNKRMATIAKELGFPMREVENYLFRRSYSPKVAAEKGFEFYKKTIKQGLDPKNPIEGQGEMTEAELDSILVEAYKTLIGGEADTPRIGKFGGSRKFKFINEEAAVKASRELGGGSIYDSFISSSNSFSRAAALFSNLGMNPEKGWKYLEEQTLKNITDPDAQLAFKTKGHGFPLFALGIKQATLREAIYKNMVGFEHVPGKNYLARSIKGVSRVNNILMLSNTLLTTAPDVAVAANALRQITGENRAFEAAMVPGFLKKFTSKKQSEMAARRYAFGISSIIDRSMSRYDSTPNNSGALNWVSNKAMSIYFLNQQSRAGTLEIADQASGVLFENAGKSFGDLNTKLKFNLEKSGIGEAEWDVLKLTAIEEGYLDLDKIQDLDPELFKGKSFNKTQLLVKASNYFQRAADSLIRGGVNEAALQNQGWNPNTPAGAAAMALHSFMSFTMAVPRIMRQILKSNPNIKGDTFMEMIRSMEGTKVAGMLMVEATLMAGAGITVGEIIQGKKPRTDLEGLGDKFYKSLAKSILPLQASVALDFVGGEYSRFGNELPVALLGPTFSTGRDFWRLAATPFRQNLEGFDERSQALLKEFGRFVNRRNVFLNNYLASTILRNAYYQAKGEYASPGYTERLIKRAEREGQEFLWDPR